MAANINSTMSTAMIIVEAWNGGLAGNERAACKLKNKDKQLIERLEVGYVFHWSSNIPCVGSKFLLRRYMYQGPW